MNTLKNYKTLLKETKERGRKVRGGVRMGNTCTPVADSCEYMARTTTIL